MVNNIKKLDSKNNRVKMKFILTSMIGIIAFMVPISYHGEINTLVGILTDIVSKLTNPIINILIVAVTLISTSLSIFVTYSKLRYKEVNSTISKLFDVKPIYLITKIVASIILIMIYGHIGTEVIIGDKTGVKMLELSQSLFTIAIAMSFFLPFLTDTGLMEFIGVLSKPIIKPLFRVPADASLDLIASWLGASSAAVLLSAEKYHKNYYTKREAAIIMCNFSLVSIPFCMMVSTVLKVQNYFSVIYITVTIIGLMLAIIMPRIKPLRTLSDEFYSENYKREEFSYNSNISIWSIALSRASMLAEKFNISDVIKTAFSILGNVVFNLLPTVIAWGTIGLILVEYTPIFTILSYPIGVVLNVLGVEEAFLVAPATLVGFIDMFIPALLCANIQSLQTRFIIAVLSLVQIIYITEVGAVIIQTNIGINFVKLLIIFLQRTSIALFIIIIISKIIF